MAVSRRTKANLGGLLTALVAFGLGIAVLGALHMLPGGPNGAPLADPQQGTPTGGAVVVPASFTQNTIQIPSQSVTAPLDPEAVDRNGYLGIPDDVHRVGWYTGAGPLDGSQGDIVLAGHVNYVGQGTGAFGHLYVLKVGDVVITRGTGKPQAWRVSGLANYSKAQGLPQDMFRASGTRALTLVTCGGTLDSRHGTYLSNVVVTAVPVPTVVQ
jgi:hypothetical protein